MEIDTLRIPLYELYYFDDISELTKFSGLTDDDLKSMKTDY